MYKKQNQIAIKKWVKSLKFKVLVIHLRIHYFMKSLTRESLINKISNIKIMNYLTKNFNKMLKVNYNQHRAKLLIKSMIIIATIK